jgi:hypothetical protein
LERSCKGNSKVRDTRHEREIRCLDRTYQL